MIQNPKFSTTNWSVVLAASRADSAVAVAALEKLCQRYWFPVYAFIRQRGHDGHEAEDLTQGFFHFLLERHALQVPEPNKGRFRTFLLTSLTNYLLNEHDKARAWKRGGRHQIISLDGFEDESTDTWEIADGQNPERAFEQQWALSLVKRVLEELRMEHDKRERGILFAALQPFLTGEPSNADYDQLGEELEMQPGTVRACLESEFSMTTPVANGWAAERISRGVWQIILT